MTLLSTFYEGDLFTYLVLPLLIFISRIMDVTIGTIRIVMVSKGQKFWAPFLGFFEVLIWLIAMSKIFENIDNWVCYVTYAAGFATGNYIGLKLEEKLAVGLVKIQIITRKEAKKLIEALIEAGYGITHQDAKGANQNVSIIYSIINRKDLHKVEKIVSAHNPNAFYSIEDVKFVNKKVFSQQAVLKGLRKGK